MAKQELIPVEQARALLLDTVNTLETEKVPLIEALGRISAKIKQVILIFLPSIIRQWMDLQ